MSNQVFLDDDSFFKSNVLNDEGVLLKAKKMPIGTVSRGFKKVAEGKWIPVRRLKEKGPQPSREQIKDIAKQTEEGETLAKKRTSKRPQPTAEQIKQIARDTEKGEREAKRRIDAQEKTKKFKPTSDQIKEIMKQTEEGETLAKKRIEEEDKKKEDKKKKKGKTKADYDAEYSHGAGKEASLKGRYR